MSERTNEVQMSEEEKAALSSHYRQIAAIVLEQLGGVNRLRMMINARDFMYDKLQTRFTFSGCTKANRCFIDLDPATDLYTMKIVKVKISRLGEFSMTTLHEQSGLYDDMLKPEFEKATQLRLSL